MFRWTVALLGLVVSAAQMPAHSVPDIDYDIVAKLPHAIDAFTQGLEVTPQGYLLEGTGLRGQSRLQLIDLANHKVLRERKLPDTLFGEGVTVHDDKVYQLTWSAGRLLVYRLANFEKVAEHRYQGEGWGLCSDGQSFVMSNGSHRLYFRDLKDFSVTRTVTVTRDGVNLRGLNELECLNGLVLANVYHKNDIVVIDPKDGKVVANINIAPLIRGERGVPNGIAWDPRKQQLLVTGKNWRTLFALKLHSIPGLK